VVTVDATGLNADGVTSQSLYGTRRGKTANKDWKDLATAVAECQRIVEAAAFGTNTYTTATTDAVASLCSPGDTAHLLYRGEEVSLRILEISRTNAGGPATLIVGDKAEALEDVVSGTRRDLATLQRSYQGVPTDATDSFSEAFERTHDGTDYAATIEFFVPYGADIIDARLRYRISGMRSFARAAAEAAASTSSTATLAAAAGGSYAATSDAGGSSTPTSGATTTNVASGGGSTSGAVTLNTGGTGGGVTNYYVYSSSPLDEAYPYAANNATGAASISLTDVQSTDQSAAGDPHHHHVNVAHSHGMHSHIHSMDLAVLKNSIANHTHAIAAHSHTVAAHTHTSNAHSHTVSIASHQHGVSIPSHTHPVGSHSHTTAAHSHSITYGIVESAAPTTGVRVYLDTTLITDLNGQTWVSDYDLLPYIPLDSNGRVSEGWHTLGFKSAASGDTGSVRGALFVRKFLATEGVG